MPKTLRELELENKLKDLENKILKEQKNVMIKNAFLGNFKRADLAHVDRAINNAKEGLVETAAALKERQKEIKAKERVGLEAKMKSIRAEKRNQRTKTGPSGKGKKKKNKKSTAEASPAEASTTQS